MSTPPKGTGLNGWGTGLNGWGLRAILFARANMHASRSASSCEAASRCADRRAGVRVPECLRTLLALDLVRAKVASYVHIEQIAHACIHESAVQPSSIQVPDVHHAAHALRSQLAARCADLATARLDAARRLGHRLARYQRLPPHPRCPVHHHHVPCMTECRLVLL